MIRYAEPSRIGTSISCHVLVAELRQVALDRIAQSELPLLGQHHDAHGGDGFRHGHDLEDTVLLHGPTGFDVCHTESVELDQFVSIRDKRHIAFTIPVTEYSTHT